MPTSTPERTSDGPGNSSLNDLAEAYHRHRMAADPLLATYHGLPIHRDELPDLSVEGEQTVRARAVELRTQAEGVDASGLSPTDATSRLMLLHLLDDDIAWVDDRWAELAVDAFMLSPTARLQYFLPRTEIADADAAQAHITRLSAVGQYLDTALDRHRTGVADGIVPVRRLVDMALEATRTAAAEPADRALPLAPLRGQPEHLRQQAAGTWRDVVAPALSRYADGLLEHVLPAARPDDRPGLCWLPDGPGMYKRFLRRYTTLDAPNPHAIHQRGLRVLADLAEEYAELGGRLFGLTDVAAIGRHLRDDPTLRYRDTEEILVHATAICGRAAAAASEVFGRLPSTPCVVKAVPAVEAIGAGAASYQVPAPGRPHGTYWVNTTDPVLHRHVAEVVAFHEAAPGHHTQLGVQVELELPTFRRIGTVLSGYSEGWGLYAERLADELGWYSSDLDRLGMLTMDSARACRLVVDTGIHQLGWSRDEAIAFMLANAPVDEALVLAEVDRYIALPGQACSYMLGRLEILRLRDRAQEELGSRFELAAFHDVVLGEGAVPLAVLSTMVEAWIAGQGGEIAGRDH